MLTPTPMASVVAKLCTLEAPSVSANQNRMAHVMRVDTLLSRMAGHARLNPMFVAESRVLPALSSSLIRSNIRILASTAMPMDRIAAATPASVSVTSKVLNTARTRIP